MTGSINEDHSMAVGITAKQTEAVASRADQKNNIQCNPRITPTELIAKILRRGTKREHPMQRASAPKQTTASAVRHSTTSRGGSRMSLPKIAVSPHASTTKCSWM